MEDNDDREQSSLGVSTHKSNTWAMPKLDKLTSAFEGAKIRDSSISISYGGIVHEIEAIAVQVLCKISSAALHLPGLERELIERAYGLLWHQSGTPQANEARKMLLSLIDKEGQRRGIQYARAIFGDSDIAREMDGVAASMFEPTTDVHKSIRDGTFSVKSAALSKQA